MPADGRWDLQRVWYACLTSRVAFIYHRCIIVPNFLPRSVVWRKCGPPQRKKLIYVIIFVTKENTSKTGSRNPPETRGKINGFYAKGPEGYESWPLDDSVALGGNNTGRVFIHTSRRQILVCIGRNTSGTCTGYALRIKSSITLYNLHFLNGKRCLNATTNTKQYNTTARCLLAHLGYDAV